jgi:prepilin-type N-terminal cleavage/methylation domain-containing protein
METIMLSPSRQFRSHRCCQPGSIARAGFTLIEIVIALAVLGTMAAGVYIGFNGINTFAVTSRLYSEAQTAAQNQIDLVLSKSPFDKDAANISGAFDPCLNRIPAELMTTAELDALTITTCPGSSGPVVFPTAAPTSTPAASAYYPSYYPYYRESSGQPIKKQAFIYHDPVSGTVVVTGTLTSTVTDITTSMTFAGTTKSLNTRKATVSVDYAFRNRNYSVKIDTLRTADQ